MWDLVGNLEDGFSHNEAQMILNTSCKTGNPKGKNPCKTVLRIQHKTSNPQGILIKQAILRESS